MRSGRILKKYSYFFILTLLFSCSGEKRAPLIPVEDFFRNPQKTSFLLSPDGRHISFLQPYKNRLNIYVQTIDGKQTRRITSETDRNVFKYFWADNHQLVYYKDKYIDESLLFAVNRDGSNKRTLISFKDVQFSLLSTVPLINNELLIGLNKRDVSALDAYRLNINTGKLTLISQNPGYITTWRADNKGKIRLAYAGNGITKAILYRDTESSPFRAIVTNHFTSYTGPIGFTKDETRIYAVSNKGRDKIAVVELDCKTGAEHRVIYNNKDVDVSNAIYSPTKQKLLYVDYVTWKKERHFLDDDYRKIFDHIGQLLPNTQIDISSKSIDETKFIIYSHTDRTPGSYYLYTLPDKTLKKLSDVNPALKESDMCQMRPVKYKTSDSTTINGYLTLPKGIKPKNLPVIVMPHKLADYRDYWGFNAEVQFLANRGYAVFQINHSGSMGYGKKFWTSGFKEWGGRMQADITDGVKWLIKEGIADPKRVGIYGSSFGGYSALYGLCFNPEIYACGASHSGLVNLFAYLKGVPPYYKAYLQMFYQMVGNPETDAEYFRSVSPVFHPDKIKVPVLIAQGGKDPQVNVRETAQFVKELRKNNVPVTYILKEDEDHCFKNEENKLDLYHQLERFFERNLKK